MIKTTSFVDVFGIAAAEFVGGEVSPGISTAGFEATIYVANFGAVVLGLNFTLQDSDDNSSWSNVLAVVNGVEAQTARIIGAQNVSRTMLVYHSAVRKFHRLSATPTGTGNFGSIVALKLGQEQSSTTGLDLIVGR
jgi:hypothetical protein